MPLIGLAYPLGLYMARVYGSLWSPSVLRVLERGSYRLVGTDPREEQDRKLGLASLSNPGPHGYTEALYAWTSMVTGQSSKGLSS